MNTASKVLIATTAAMLAMAGGTALAKHAPYVPERAAAAPADEALNQPLGAMRESHYFNAPALTTGGSPVFRCRGNTSLFDKATLVRTC